MISPPCLVIAPPIRSVAIDVGGADAVDRAMGALGRNDDEAHDRQNRLARRPRRRVAILAALDRGRSSPRRRAPTARGCARRYPTPRATTRARNTRRPPTASAPRSTAPSAYAHSIGCDHRQFLFFGSPPPPQCGQINAQIGRMRANLDELQSRAGGAGGRGELIARYNAQCVNAAPAQPTNFLAALVRRRSLRSRATSRPSR